jgi:Zn ribbon nucleic-acid-binding protein
MFKIERYTGRNEILLSIDAECPKCHKEQAWSNTGTDRSGERCCMKCGYIFPDIYIAKNITI